MTASVSRRALLSVALVAAGALAAMPRAAVAQSTVVGVVYDSIARRPLPKALVQVVLSTDPSVARSASTDSIGRFQLDSVAPGLYVIGFQHPRLDELLLRAPLLPLKVDSAPVVRMDLATPSEGTMVAATCPAAAQGQGAVMLGHVRDADTLSAAGGATVVVTWTETVLDRATARKRLRAVNATADDEGRFLLCGVPAGEPVVARATAPGGRTSGEVTIEAVNGGLVARDFLVAMPGSTRQGTARVVGRVRRPDGSPLSGASVAVYGSSRTATTDAQGSFTLDALPPGSATLEARAVGFNPERVPVDLANGRADTAVVTLAPLPPQLDTVTVVGRDTRTGIDGFDARARRGFGHFITSDVIERRRPLLTSDLLRTVPGLTVQQTGMRGARVTLRNCQPAVFVDGNFVVDGASNINDFANPNEIAGIEVYSSQAEAPIEFQRGGCGVMVIWTKRGGR